MRMRINGGSWQTFNVPQTAYADGVFTFSTFSLGNFALNTGNNTIEFASGDGYMVFRELCAGSGGCTTPSAPSISVTSSNTTTCADGSATVTISASGCSDGTINWSNGQSGSSINVTTAGNYTATCSLNGCTSSASNTVSVSNGSCGSSSNPSGTYEGYLDVANCNSIDGWVWLPGSSHRVIIEILDGGTVIHEMVANTNRADLQPAGKGDGNHAFYYSTPSSLKNGQNHSISVRVKGINQTLTNSPITLNCSGSNGMLSSIKPSAAMKVAVTEAVQVYPNPASNEINLRYFMKKDGHVSVRLLDIMGRVKQVRILQGRAGINQTLIQIAKGVPEIFFVETNIDGQRWAKTMIRK
jgi:hypothetical protein